MWNAWFRNILDFEMSLAAGLTGLGVALGAVVLSQMALVAVLVALPADFFCKPGATRSPSLAVEVARWVARIAKNIAGAVLLLLGIPLALPGIPGPGLVLVLVGIALLDFPGKRKLQRRLLGHPRVWASINSLRSRFGRPGLILCDPHEPSTAASTVGCHLT